MIAIIPCAIICARLWYVLNSIEEFNSFEEVINIKNGGLAIYGGVAGGALGIFIICKIKKIKWITIADVGCCLLPLGQAIGRWGNFFNQEVYGMPTTATFPFGVYISAYGEWRVALFFIESILNLALFIAMYIWFIKAKPKKSGYFLATYFIGYGVIRFILEPFRDPQFNLIVLGIKSQVLTSALVVTAGLIVLIICLWRDGYIKKFLSLFNKNKTEETKNDDTLLNNSSETKSVLLEDVNNGVEVNSALDNENISIKGE
jgi:phosphatidylglycerol:prolipoprotein diacylglycerol transferase